MVDHAPKSPAVGSCATPGGDASFSPRRRLGWIVSATLSVSLAAGCSVLQPEHARRPSESVGGHNTRITYRTDSARLNVLAGGSSTQLVSFQQPTHQAVVPEFTVCTLKIEDRHPSGNPEVSLVTVTFEAPADDDAASLHSKIWTTISGARDDHQPRQTVTHHFRETWTMDVPSWQLDAVVAELRKENFFKRAKSLNAKALIVAEIDGRRFGKDFRAIPELDGMILRVRREGRQIGGRSSSAHLFDPSAAWPSGTGARRIPEVRRLPPTTPRD